MISVLEESSPMSNHAVPFTSSATPSAISSTTAGIIFTAPVTTPEMSFRRASRTAAVARTAQPPRRLDLPERRMWAGVLTGLHHEVAQFGVDSEAYREALADYEHLEMIANALGLAEGSIRRLLDSALEEFDRRREMRRERNRRSNRNPLSRRMLEREARREVRLAAGAAGKRGPIAQMTNGRESAL